jgi:hypothetical protein
VTELEEVIMAGNFIKIDRKILKWEWWSDINTFRLFMYMLISAYWKDGNYKGKIIERGSFPSSISELSKETNLSVMEIRTSLKHLQLTGEITSKATNKFTIFTVVNYNLYQTDNKQDNKQITSNLTNNQQTDNILLTNSILKESKNERTEEIKEDKNTEKDITNVISKKKSYYPDDELLDEAFNEYVTMRKKIKKPICTDKALHRAMNTLEKLSGGDNDLAVKILNQSVDHCWQGLFELKEDNSNKQQGKKNVFDEWMEVMK